MYNKLYVKSIKISKKNGWDFPSKLLIELKIHNLYGFSRNNEQARLGMASFPPDQYTKNSNYTN